MFVFKFKAYGKEIRHQAMDEAIKTARSIRKKCMRHWNAWGKGDSISVGSDLSGQVLSWNQESLDFNKA